MAEHSIVSDGHPAQTCGMRCSNAALHRSRLRNPLIIKRIDDVAHGLHEMPVTQLFHKNLTRNKQRDSSVAALRRLGTGLSPGTGPLRPSIAQAVA